MIVWLRHVLGWLRSAFCTREDLILENLALRQQLLALHAQRPRRRLTASHKLFWVVLRRCWARWKEPLIQVTPRTVVGWHRADFRLYWKWLSRAKSRGARKPVSKEIRALIFQMVAENPTWGAPRRSKNEIALPTAMRIYRLLGLCFVFRRGSTSYRHQQLECCCLAFSSRKHYSAGSNNLGMRSGRDDLKLQGWWGNMGNETSKSRRRSVVGYFFCE